MVRNVKKEKFTPVVRILHPVDTSHVSLLQSQYP